MTLFTPYIKIFIKIYSMAVQFESFSSPLVNNYISVKLNIDVTF